MISRRNIRIKVMQVLYAFETKVELVDNSNLNLSLQKNLNQSSALFVYLLYFITKIARYAETDARVRASRNLLSESDLNVSIKISGNDVLWKILENESYKKAAQFYKPELLENIDLIKKIYNQLAESEIYKQYIVLQNRNNKIEKNILQFIFTTLMLPNENFIAHLEDHFTNWDDDVEMMNQLVLNYLAKPEQYNLQDLIGADKLKFAKDLLVTTLEKKSQLTEYIIPKLQNWDAERIAMLDMILMQMGVCEFLYFETIPPKVTINEYIDIAKEYSTSQSGQFVNGILDSIHKDLVSQQKIYKIDFKQKA